MMFAECSYANFNDGNYLAKDMFEQEKSDNDNSKNMFSVGNYSGYITGVADTTAGIIWCPLSNVTIGQITKIVSKYLTNNPEKLHLSADYLVEEALKSAFPCKK